MYALKWILERKHLSSLSDYSCIPLHYLLASLDPPSLLELRSKFYKQIGQHWNDSLPLTLCLLRNPCLISSQSSKAKL